MKIGILTFHWATNYGAILQAYALQEYLTKCGHNVKIINYKPKTFDFSWMFFIKHPSAMFSFGTIMRKRKKEKLLATFRNEYLHITRRYYSIDELQQDQLDFDVVISGSDQILNPSFTYCGEKKPTPTYYLSFAKKVKSRIGYAVSFGCVDYPSPAIDYAQQWINNFTQIGVREETGLSILQDLNYKGNSQLVPDPTILRGKELFNDIQINSIKKSYTCVYMLRKKIKINGDNLIYIDESKKPISMEEWLSCILNAKTLITNSYHGMIVALLNHVPFVALMEIGNSAGMNDRFNTLLRILNLEYRLTDDKNNIDRIIDTPIDWQKVDVLLNKYKKVGSIFLQI